MSCEQVKFRGTGSSGLRSPMGVANRQNHHVKRVRLEQDTSVRLDNPLLFCMSRGTTCYAVSSDLTVCMACSDPAMIQSASHSRHYRTALNKTNQFHSAPPVACSPLSQCHGMSSAAVFHASLCP